MIHVALDLHRDSCMVQALNDVTGELLIDAPLPSEKQALLDVLTPLRDLGSLRIVMESCGFAGYWADVCDPLGDVAVLHSRYVAQQRRGKRKFDRRDTDTMLRMSCQDDLPRSYIGTTAERDWKDLLRYRVGLVRIGTRLRVRLRNVAQRYGARLPSSDVDSAKGRRLWAEWELRPTHRLIVDDLLTVLAAVDARIMGVEQTIEALAPQMAPARPVEILDSLPGLGRFGSLLAAAEIGDWHRFPRAQSLPCYAGLVPSEESSGDRVVRGRITKEGPCYLRWIMVQAAMKAECSPRLDALYQRVAQRRGAMKARVAVARELLEIAWHLLHKDVLYEERTPRGVAGVQPAPAGDVSREARETPEKVPKSRRSGQFEGPQTR